MKIQLKSTVLLLAVLVPAGFAQTPKPADAKAAPAAPAAKAAPDKKAPPPAATPTAQQLELKSAVEKFVAEVSEENDGLYPLNDTMSDDAWNVSLKGFDWPATRSIDAEEKLVRALFSGQGKNFTVDFTARKDGKTWEIVDEIIFAVDGVARFVYNDKNERIPVAAKGGKAGKAAEALPEPEDDELMRADEAVEDETPLETEDADTDL